MVHIGNLILLQCYLILTYVEQFPISSANVSKNLLQDLTGRQLKRVNETGFNKMISNVAFANLAEM